MLVKFAYWVGRVLAILLASVSVLVVGIAAGMREQHWPIPALPWLVALLLVGLPVVIVVHEAGHLLACLALRVRVRGVEIGSGRPPRLRFTVRGVEVSLGAPYSGQVLYIDPGSAGRNVAVTAAGGLANLVAAAVLFAVGTRRNPIAATAPLPAGQGWNPVAAAVLFVAGHTGNFAVFGLALLMMLVGVTSFLPYRQRNGRTTDGERLLALLGGLFARALCRRAVSGSPPLANAPATLRPHAANGLLPPAGTPATLNAEYQELVRHEARQLSPEQTARWLKAYWEREPLALPAAGIVGRSLRLQGRISELLALHADLPRPAGPRASQLTVAAHSLDRQVLMVPGLPAKAVNVAVARVEWVLRTAEFKPAGQPWSREVVLHTLALGKLRQGRFAEVEELCQPILALPRPGSRSRATVLATVALARHAAGLPCEAELAEARFLDPDADLVAEAWETCQAQGVRPGLGTPLPGRGA